MVVKVIDFPNPDILLQRYRVVCDNCRCQALLEYTQNDSNYDKEYDYYFVVCPKCKARTSTRLSTKVEEVGMVYDDGTTRVTIHKSCKVVYAYKNNDDVEFFGVDGLPLSLMDALNRIRVPDHNMNEIYDKCAKLLGLQPTLRSKLP